MPPAPSPVDDPLAAAGPPPWMARTGRPEAPRLPPVVEPNFDQPEAANPMQRYGAEPAPPQPQYRGDEPGDERDQEPSRYDDALFGQLDSGGPAFQREQPYPDDPYAFQDEGYDEGDEEEAPKRGGGLTKFAMFLALVVIGTGAAFAYRTFMGPSRSGDPPIIRADNSPTKIIAAVPADGIPKLPDRLGDQGEKVVSREEAPVDVNSRSVSPRVVFPPLNQNGSAPTPNAAATDAMQMPPVATSDSPAPSSGTMPAGEPRRIKTLSVRGDQGDGGAAPAAAAASTAVTPKAMKGRNSPASANASANAPMPLTPQAAAPAAEKRMAAASPAPAQDAAASAAPAAAGGGYMVQVSSQKSEADAQASFRAVKTKYADAMGSYSAPVIKRVDIPGKGVMFRAMVGPFDTSDEAVQFCNGLKTAGGQCLIQRN
jgi:SPOR domain